MAEIFNFFALLYAPECDIYIEIEAELNDFSAVYLRAWVCEKERAGWETRDAFLSSKFERAYKVYYCIITLRVMMMMMMMMMMGKWEIEWAREKQGDETARPRETGIFARENHHLTMHLRSDPSTHHVYPRNIPARMQIALCWALTTFAIVTATMDTFFFHYFSLVPL